MMVTALTLVGPTLYRIALFNLKLPAYIPYKLLSLIIIDILLAILLLKDYKNRWPAKTLRIYLLIYGLGQIFFLLSHTLMRGSTLLHSS